MVIKVNNDIEINITETYLIVKDKKLELKYQIRI